MGDKDTTKAKHHRRSENECDRDTYSYDCEDVAEITHRKYDECSTT